MDTKGIAVSDDHLKIPFDGFDYLDLFEEHIAWKYKGSEETPNPEYSDEELANLLSVTNDYSTESLIVKDHVARLSLCFDEKNKHRWTVLIETPSSVFSFATSKDTEAKHFYDTLTAWRMKQIHFRNPQG